MSATSGGGGSLSEGSEAGGSSHSTMSVSDSPSTSFQTNLADNVTKITLSEENSAGEFGGDMTGSKINLSLDERHQKDGIVNVAFDYEEGTNRGGGVGGGDFKSINGSEKKVPEAVNLELVNMVPYSNGNGTSYGVPINGIPMKKDSEQVDMSTPYDEYFVPVNEHKKYMRGEKLYVTKDKRRPTSWRRCLSWIVACTVISVVLIVAILAGTGVILSQDSNFVNEASVGRNFAGSNSKPSVTNKTPIAEKFMYVPRSIESEFVIDNLDFDPALKDLNSSAYHEFTTTMEDQLKLLLFDQKDLDLEASDIGLKIVNISHDPFKVNYRIGWNYKEGVTNPPEPIKIEDVKRRFLESLSRNQGYIDKYHIDSEAIKVNHVINTCQKDNGGCSHICYYNYNNQQFTCTCPTHLVLDSRRKNCVAWTDDASEDDALPVPSRTSNSETMYQSTVNPTHHYELGSHPGQGVYETYDKSFEHKSNSYENEGQGKYEPTSGLQPTGKSNGGYYESTGSDSGSYDKHNIHSTHKINGYDNEAKTDVDYSDYAVHAVHGSKEPSTESTPEPSLTKNEHNLDAYHLDESKDPEPSAEPTPEPTGEFNEEKTHDRFGHTLYGNKEHEPTAEPTPESSGTVRLDGKTQDLFDHSLRDYEEHQRTVETTLEGTADGATEGKAHDQFDYSPSGNKEHQSTIEPIPKPTADEVLEGNFHHQLSHTMNENKEHEPVIEPTQEPSADGASDGKTHDQFDHSLNENKDHETAAEPSQKPTTIKTLADKTYQFNHFGDENKEHEPTAEPTPEPTAREAFDGKTHDQIGQSLSANKEHEPVAEPTPEPTADETNDGKTHDHIGQSVGTNKEHEPVAEPTPEPTADETNDGKTHDHIGQSVATNKEHEPVAEPTPEPTADETNDGKTHDHIGQSVGANKEHEPVAEPTPEPTADETNDGKTHDHIGQSVGANKEHEPVAEPTPEPTADETNDGKTHDQIGQSLSANKEHEPVAEPTPEPIADETNDGKTHDHIGQSVGANKEHEPVAEPTPEPIADETNDGKTHDQIGQSVGANKEHEPVAEPTPEPTADETNDGKTHDQIGQSVSANKEHEPVAEATPEPTAEDGFDGKTHNQFVNILNANKEHKTENMPTSKSAEKSYEGKGNDQFGQAVNLMGDNKPIAESKQDFVENVFNRNKQDQLPSEYVSNFGEPMPVPKTYKQSGHFENYNKSFESTTENMHLGDSNVFQLKTKEYGNEEKSMSEVYFESPTKSEPNHSIQNIKNNEQTIKTSEFVTSSSVKGIQDFESDYSGSKTPINFKSNEGNGTESSPESQNHETNIEFKNVLGNEPSFHASVDQSDTKMQPNSNANSPSATSQSPFGQSVNFDDHHHGETTTRSNSKNTNTESNVLKTSFSAGPQENISNEERPLVSRPVTQDESSHKNVSRQNVPYLEDILIKKSSPGNGGQNHNPLENVEVDAGGRPLIEEVIINKPKTTNQYKGTLSIDKLPDEEDMAKAMGVVNTYADEVINPEGSTKRSALQSGNSQPETATELPTITEYTSEQGNVPGSDTLSILKKNQDSNQSVQNLNEKPHLGLKTIKSENEHNLDHPKVSDMRNIKVYSDVQYESQTIPVTIELLNPADGKINTGEAQAQSPVANVNGSRINATDPDQPNRKTDSENPDYSNNHSETKSSSGAVESQVPLTTSTLPSVLISKEGMSTREYSVTSQENSKTSDVENKTNGESHQTTRSPEDISNNIKDELLENDEFNTLLDTEITTSDGKDILSKYPNKVVKVEKKKIKDFIKSDKIDFDKKAEVTGKTPVNTEDFLLQKHVNANGHTYDLDFSLQNEHTTKHDGGISVTDPHSIDGIPGVSLTPHGINNQDISSLRTVAPDFKAETIVPVGGSDFERSESDSRNKVPEVKDVESKGDKDFKFDKDYKYDKQKVSKKKDLKKKIGGKDGKNVELEDGRKYYIDDSKDEFDVSHEIKNSETTDIPYDKITLHSETGLNTKPDFIDSDLHELNSGVKDSPGSVKGRIGNKQPFSSENSEISQENRPTVDQNGHLLIDEPAMKSSTRFSPGTAYEGQLSGNNNNFHNIKFNHSVNLTPEFPNFNKSIGTVYDGTSQFQPIGTKFVNTQSGTGQNFTNVVFESGNGAPNRLLMNSTTAHPTIIIHGQSGNLQDGHVVRFANSTFQTPNATFMTTLNGTFVHSNGQVFGFPNYTTTFPNGSAVHPTIVIRGQSGTLQDGHEAKFGNYTFQTFATPPSGTYKNSNVFRIENSTSQGTVFDGHFNPQNGHYHMYTNASGTYVYSNSSVQPKFIIKGENGDFGNSTAFILKNDTIVPSGFALPQSVIFRNSTVFAMKSTENGDAIERQEITVQPDSLMSNETIQFTHQMSPSFVSSGTAYKVNNYFGYISKCAAGQFQCVNGTSKRGSACVSLSSKCDSINDCSDGSDELGCIENGCPGNFQCSDSTCLKRNLVCNGILDCSDGSDEKNCENWKCEFDEFQCPSGRCIPVVWQCDSKPDCDNHTDEYNCQTSCGNDEFLCPEGWCIPLTYKCNGIKECSNGEDEQLCDCSHEEFKCQTGGCVSLTQVCNGVDDCPDRSDEWDCVKIESKSNKLKIRSASGKYEPVCADNWTSQYSDEVCTFLGYSSSVPVEKENNLITTETSFYFLKNDTTADFNKKIIVNLHKSEEKCSSGKLVEISCQDFSCGSRSMTDSSSVEARLVGGMSATAGQWPSVALLYNIRNFHSCTANVLTPRWVLASYNCLKMGNKILNEQDWKFFGGSTIFEAEKENAETRKIVSIIPHPQVKFNQFLFSNDFALVELHRSLQFTSNVGAVCLPEQEMQPRQICVTAGWGMDTPEDKSIRQQLQYLPVPTMNLTECNSTDHYSGFITNDKICAGYNSAQKSLCYNEEGAPLMCVNDRGEWELQGVLSYHSNCGRGSHPSIFSSITPVANWIKKTIGNSFERKISAVTKR